MKLPFFTFSDASRYARRMRPGAVLLFGFALCALGESTAAPAEPHEDFLLPHKSTEKLFKIEKIYSADQLNVNGQRIKLIGLKAPDAPARQKLDVDEHGIIVRTANPIIPLDQQAFNFVRELLEGQTVRLEYDTQYRDTQGRTLAYVYLKDGTFVNAEILRQGFAALSLEPPNIKHAPALRAAYQEARREKRGLQGE